MYDKIHHKLKKNKKMKKKIKNRLERWSEVSTLGPLTHAEMFRFYSKQMGKFLKLAKKGNDRI